MTQANANQKTAHVMIMAGGTGGHIFPGIAVAKAFENSGWSVSWLGSCGGMEERLVNQANIEIDLITVAGVRGKGILGWLKMPFALSKAVLNARKIIKKRRPQVVVGFGGFVAGPGGLATRLTNTPLVIHEQNAIAGMTNRVLAVFAKRVFQAFPGAFDSDKAETVGNPVREDFVELSQRVINEIESKDVLTILVIGGSRGALALNQYLPKIFTPLLMDKKIKVLHQVGSGREVETREFYLRAGYRKAEEAGADNLSIVEFIDDMAHAFSEADLIICRAGASTVSEVAAAGKAAIFVPYPYAVDDHQSANADWLVSRDAAVKADESQLKNDRFEKTLKDLITRPERIASLARNARQQAMLNAADSVVNYCERFRKKVA